MRVESSITAGGCGKVRPKSRLWDHVSSILRSVGKVRRRSRARSEQQTVAPAARSSAPSAILPCALVFLVALGVRLLHLWSMRHSPYYGLLLGDAERYDSWGRELAAGHWLGSGVFYQAPLYPYILGVIYSILGHSLTLVRVIQAVWGSAACALVCWSAFQLFGRATALAAGLILSIYGPAIFFDFVIQKSSLDALLVATISSACVALSKRPNYLSGLIFGLCLGLFALNRENALVLIPLSAIWVAVALRRASIVGVTVLGATIVLTPVLVRNRLVGHEWVLTSSQLGPNLFIGNNASATGTYAPLIPGHGSVKFEESDARKIAEREARGPLQASQVSSYWRRQAFAWTRDHPKEATRLTATKLALLLNRREAADSEDIDSHSEDSAVLQACAAVGNFGTLAPLAAAGIFLSRRRWRCVSWFYLFLVAYGGSVLAFFVLDRYRYPLVPVIAIFAAAGIICAIVAWRRRTMSESMVVGLLLLITAIGSNWPIPILASQRVQAVTVFNAGRALEETGQSVAAIELYRRAITLAPSFAPAHGNLAALLARNGRFDDATAEFEEALRLDPRLSEVRSNYGSALAEQGRFGEAIGHLREAVSLEPESAENQYNLGTALANAGDLPAAQQAFEAALRITPDKADAHNNLGIVLASQGQLDAAIRHFKEAVRLQPNFTGAKANLDKAEHLRRLQ